MESLPRYAAAIPEHLINIEDCSKLCLSLIVMFFVDFHPITFTLLHTHYRTAKMLSIQSPNMIFAFSYIHSLNLYWFYYNCFDIIFWSILKLLLLFFIFLFFFIIIISHSIIFTWFSKPCLIFMFKILQWALPFTPLGIMVYVEIIYEVFR